MGTEAFRVASFHAAPNRAPRARAAGMARFAKVRAKFKGGDLNLTARLAAVALGRKVVGVGVLCLTVPRAGWRVLEVESHDVQSDHEAMLVRLRNRRTKTEISVLVINCMSVSTGPAHAAKIMHLGIALGADIIIASECRDFWAAEVDRQNLYWWHQPGPAGSSESGALIGCLRSTANMSERIRLVGSTRTEEGDGIDERSIVRALITLKK